MFQKHQMQDYADQVTGRILTTKNYGQFKSFVGNRDVRERKDLLQSIATSGLINPIIVDRQLNVIDGQHRLYACKTLGIPVEYMVRDFDERTIVDVNQHQLKWVPQDYLMRYVKMGYPDYMTFHELIKEAKLSVKQGFIVVRSGGGTKMRKKDTILFVTGEFKISPQEVDQFKGTMVLLKEIFATSGGENEAKLRYGSLFDALVKLVNLPKYNHAHFLERLNETPTHRIKPRGTMADMYEMLEGIYNYKLKKGRINLAAKPVVEPE